MMMAKRIKMKRALELYEAEQECRKNPNKNRKNKHIETKVKLRVKLKNLYYRYLTNKRPDLAQELELDIDAPE
jgi:hypothetical protein